MAGMLIYFGPIGREDISIVDADDNNVFEFVRKKADGMEEVTRDRIVISHGPHKDNYIIDYSNKDLPHPAYIHGILAKYGIDLKNMAGQPLSFLKYRSAMDVASRWAVSGNRGATEVNLDIARYHAGKAGVPVDTQKVTEIMATLNQEPPSVSKTGNTTGKEN